MGPGYLPARDVRASSTLSSSCLMLEALALLGSGFLLGMIHAGDPDDVVAVRTIVSDQRSVRRAGLVGALWGIGLMVTLVLLSGAVVVIAHVVLMRSEVCIM